MSLASKIAAAKAAWKGSYYVAKAYLDLRARWAAWRVRDDGPDSGVAGKDRGGRE